MKNLEKAKKDISKCDFTKWIPEQAELYIFNKLELASQPDFHFYENKDLPPADERVIFYDEENVAYIGKHFINDIFMLNFHPLKWVKWCEIPV